MSSIVPSTKLKIVSVHKLKAMTCLRKYFWRWILNLEPQKLNDSFWYGSILGAGFEALLSGKNAEIAMTKEDKRRRKRYTVAPDMEEELGVQRRLISAIMREAKRQPDVKKMKITKSQAMFKVGLKESGLLFCGTKDGEGFYDKTPCDFEIRLLR
jgi:hypothetical protein